MKKILVLFETSGAISVPFRQAGFDVTTIDILPHQIDNAHHIQYDIRHIEDLHIDYSEYIFMFAFPPCTYFSKAGLHWLYNQPGRFEKQQQDLEMIKKLWNIPIFYKCFENPGGSALNKLWRRADCLVDYCQFADFKKPTCLWLQGLPPLLPTQINLKHYGNLITRLSGYARNITPIEFGYAVCDQYKNYFI